MTHRRAALGSFATASLAVLGGCVIPGRSESDTETTIHTKWEHRIRFPRFGVYDDTDRLLVAPLNEPRGFASPNASRGLVSVDPATGDVAWELALNGNAEHELATDHKLSSDISPPLVIEDTVYAMSDLGYCFALDAGSGDLMWDFRDGSLARPGTIPRKTKIERPVRLGSTVCVLAQSKSGDNTRIIGHDSETGELEFEYGVDDELHDGPVTTDTALVIPQADGILEAIGSDGNLQWTTTVDTDVFSITASDDQVVVVGQDRILVAIDGTDGTTRWETEIGVPRTKPMVCDESVLFGSGEELVAVSLDRGEKSWTESIGTAGTRLTVTERYVLILGGVQGRLRETESHAEYQQLLSIHDRETGTQITEHIHDEPPESPRMNDIHGFGEQVFLSRGNNLSELDTTQFE